MKLLPEDPRITTYAFGEIEDEQERIEIEAAVNASPELQAVVADIRGMGALLNVSFAEELAPELSEFEKAKLGAPVSEPATGRRISTWLFFTSAAAIALLAFVIVPQLSHREETFTYQAQPRESAKERSTNEPKELTDSNIALEGSGSARYRDMDVSIPDELIEGTPQPIKVQNLELASTEAPRMVMKVPDQSVVTGLDGGALGANASSSLKLAEPSTVQSQRKPSAVGQVSKTQARATQSPFSDVDDMVVEQAFQMYHFDKGDGLSPDMPMVSDSESSVGRTAPVAMSPPAPVSLRLEQRSAPVPQTNPKPKVAHVRSVGAEKKNEGIVINDFLSFEGFVDMDYSQSSSLPVDEAQDSFAIDQVEIKWLFFESSTGIVNGGCFPQPKSVLEFNTENYDQIEETDFRSPLVAPLSTFSIDVDTASYANVRRFLNQGKLPPEDAVRIEELINYFPYADAAPTKSLDDGGDPFAVHMAQTMAPWNTKNRLLRIALKGYEMPWEERPASNLVFLLDVSGSMNQPNKLPLVKDAMDLLIRRLDERDRVAIVVYAGASGLVLPSTTANNHETIEHALENLKAGGSTNAGAGVELAYATARKHFIEGGNNRVILCTDGDFNVGQTNRGELAETAEVEAEQGVSLTILGFGMGNYKDGMLETLSNKGKGTYAYVDSQSEARKVFIQDLASNLFKIAKDVKIQVEFNPAQVKGYRLLGYENRRLKAEDFNNDAKKAGDIGPGHTIVALYEIVPPGSEVELSGVDALRYQATAEAELVEGEVATVKLRYKQPDGDVSKLITHSVSSDNVVSMEESSADMRFSAAVAAFGLRLSGSKHVQDYSFDAIEKLAVDSLGTDPGGHRSEFSELVRKADSLTK